MFPGPGPQFRTHHHTCIFKSHCTNRFKASKPKTICNRCQIAPKIILGVTIYTNGNKQTKLLFLENLAWPLKLLFLENLAWPLLFPENLASKLLFSDHTANGELHKRPKCTRQKHRLEQLQQHIPVPESTTGHQLDGLKSKQCLHGHGTTEPVKEEEEGDLRCSLDASNWSRTPSLSLAHHPTTVTWPRDKFLPLEAAGVVVALSIQNCCPDHRLRVPYEPRI